jgi:hypothetical protein
MQRRRFLESAFLGSTAMLIGFPTRSAQAASTIKITKIRYYAAPNYNKPLFNQARGIVEIETNTGIIGIGEGGSKGNIRMKATENIELDGKKVILNAKAMYKLATSGKAEIAANSCLSIYSSVIRGVTDAVANKDGKNGGRNFQVKQAEF